MDGEDIEVSEEIYREYAKIGRKIEYIEFDLKRNRVLQDADGKAVIGRDGLPVILVEREVSFDKLIDEDWEFSSSVQSPEDIFIEAECSEISELHRCVALLTEEEQALIKALFFDGLTEQEYAETLGVKQQAVHKRKKRILEKIKNFFSKGC